METFNIRLYVFCLLSNHFHLVFETPEGNCSKFMHALTTAYTVYFNRRHGRHGHLVDGRFRGKLVEGDSYLLALSRYVHLNPVKVGGTKHKPIEEKTRALRQSPWSSYPGYIGGSKRLAFVDRGPMLAQMHGKRGAWPKRYREFVESGLAEDDEDMQAALKASPRSIGSEAFRAWVDERYQKLTAKHTRPEDVSFRRITEPLRPEAVVATLAQVLEVPPEAFGQRRRDSALRAVASRLLERFAGLTQRQIAGYLGMGTGGAVSAQVRRLPALLAGDRRLRALYRRAEGRLLSARAAPAGP